MTTITTAHPLIRKVRTHNLSSYTYDNRYNDAVEDLSGKSLEELTKLYDDFLKAEREHRITYSQFPYATLEGPREHALLDLLKIAQANK